jgi:uncharacterized protein
MGAAAPAIGIGYRRAIDRWTRDNLRRFDLLEITVDHCILGSEAMHEQIYELVGQVPLTAHGIGLSIGTDVPLDLTYLDRVAAIVDRLGAPTYSEHLAFTRIPGRDIANLLPLPRTEAVAAAIIEKVRIVQSRVPVPFLLENIAHVFDWPDAELGDAEFISLICRETGAGILLDVENLYVNGCNHGIDALAYLDALPAGSVQELHMAGGEILNEHYVGRIFHADTHNRPVPAGALDLLDHTLARHRPASIVLERDDRLNVTEEILEDLALIRARVEAHHKVSHVEPALRPAV